MRTDKITPNLWFNTEAEEAARFYTSIFKNSTVGAIRHFTKMGQDVHKKEQGSVMTVEFYIEGQRFLALNGGPEFKFNEAISMIVNCNSQEEIDYFWNKLNEGGDPEAQRCGWLKDKYGLSWQVVPTILPELIEQEDKAEKVMGALMKMKKINLKELEEAAASA